MRQECSRFCEEIPAAFLFNGIQRIPCFFLRCFERMRKPSCERAACTSFAERRGTGGSDFCRLLRPCSHEAMPRKKGREPEAVLCGRPALRGRRNVLLGKGPFQGKQRFFRGKAWGRPRIRSMSGFVTAGQGFLLRACDLPVPFSFFPR